MVLMQPTWRLSSYKLFSTMVLCNILMCFSGSFYLLAWMGLISFRLSHRCYHPNSSLICFVHDWCPLYDTWNKFVYQTFQVFPIVYNLERALQSLYKCFSNFPKKHLELAKVGVDLKNKKLENPKQCQDPWISMFTPFKRVL